MIFSYLLVFNSQISVTSFSSICLPLPPFFYFRILNICRIRTIVCALIYVNFRKVVGLNGINIVPLTNKTEILNKLTYFSMIVHFSIKYHTYYGQDIVLNVDSISEDGKRSSSRFGMHTNDGTSWTCDVNVVGSKTSSMIYYYSVERLGTVERREWQGVPHRLVFDCGDKAEYYVYDKWNDVPYDSYMYSSAVTECLRKNAVDYAPCCNAQVADTVGKTLRLRVKCGTLSEGETLVLTGDGNLLGDWRPEHGIAAVAHSAGEWTVDVAVDNVPQNTLEFKFVAMRNGAVRWEQSDNRKVVLPEMHKGDVVVMDIDAVSFDCHPVRCAGTLVPVFSLKSESSFGVGDFGDLKKMIDWVRLTGQRVLQVLPINDTTTTHTWTDSYPYSCISIFALHPQYADLSSLPPIADEASRNRLETLRQELNALPKIDYERVNDAKAEYLHIIYEQEGKKVLASDEFRTFFKESEEWLVPYAHYCYLRDTNGTADFSKWDGNTEWNEADRKNLSSPRCKMFKEVAYYYYVQFVLDSQMRAVHNYARSKGVVLKGDIPIGVSRYGCDVWSEPRYFNLNGQAGAPPDDFSVNGQNWGFPTYNWETMIADGCQWWVRRFQNMSKYFDAYRIDHVLGFFRIWEIPYDAVHGLLGHFSPALGMTVEEIEGYGLKWQEELFTEPLIMDWVLDRTFGEDADVVRRNFVEPTHDGRYKMRGEYNTQRKIESWYAGADESQYALRSTLADFRDGLYSLISDVLFVRDHRNPNLFHPRISVQFDFIYEYLYDSDKDVFNRLYNDYYYKRNNQYWYNEAMKKLPMLVSATRMLVCAEDLGMVPDCVPWVMDELKILSLELQSMPKDPEVRFGHLSRNPYRSVATISSHDMPTLRQWWDEDWQRTQEYYNTRLYRGDAAPHPLPGWLAKDILSRHLTCPSMLCILSIQDWLSMDERLRLADADAERINIPSNPKHYWRYRLHLSIEDLIAATSFNDTIKEMISQSGRK